MQVGVRFGPFGRPLGFRQTEFVIPGRLCRFAFLETTDDKNITLNIILASSAGIEFCRIENAAGI
jgi:hypothetical protein